MDEATARAAFEAALGSYKQEFGTFFIARLLDLRIDYVDERCIVTFPIRDFLFNPQGSLHGGIITTAMDISMGHLLHRSLGVSGATLEMKVQFLRPARQGTARCEGRFLKRGNSICFLESRLFAEAEALCAVATSTWKPGFPKKPGG